MSSSSSPIQLSGFASGLPVNDIISQLIAVERRPIDLLKGQKAKIDFQQSIYSNVKARVEGLQKALKTLTIDSSFSANDTDLFKSQKATSSDEKVAKATASSTASAQSFTLEVVSLATSTKATSTAAVGQTITNATAISDAAMGSVTTGNFTVFYNGVGSQIAVNTGDTINDVFNRITAAVPGITPTIVGGKVNLAFADGNTVQLGAANDTSNFLTAMQLNTGTFTDIVGPTSQIESANPILAFNPNTSIDTPAANLSVPVTSGTFTINGVSFDTTGKTFNELLSDINNSSAKVTAGFNPSTNQLTLTSTNPGSAMISMADGTSNFLTAMGLISGGNSTASQTAGANAQFKINGGAVLLSPSNSVSDSITGLTGVTLDLKTTNVGTPITITVGRDTEAISTAVEDVVKKFNDLVTYVDDQTKSAEKEADRGPLNGERSLVRFRQDIRTIVTDAIAGLSGTKYDSLPLAGVSTGAVTGASTTASKTLVFDKAKFEAALADDPDAIRKLFIASTASEGYDGVLTRLQTSIDNSLTTQALSGTDGLFASISTSAQNRIKTLNDSIERAEARLETKEKLLRQQFLVMEQLISQYQSQGSAITAMNSQLSANQQG